MKRKRELTVFEQHQLRIAKQTIKMSDAMVAVMGPPSKKEAYEIIKRLTVREKVMRKFNSCNWKYIYIGKDGKVKRNYTLPESISRDDCMFVPESIYSMSDNDLLRKFLGMTEKVVK